MVAVSQHRETGAVSLREKVIQVCSPFPARQSLKGAAKVTVRGKAVNGKRRTVHSYSYCKSLDTTKSDCMIKKEMIAMLLAGRLGKPSRCAHGESGKTGSSIWRKVSNHRLPAQ